MSVNRLKNQYSRTRKKSSYRDLEKKLDRIFSEYIRLSNTLNKDSEYCRCITCGNVYHWKEIDCGHFISRSVKATRFNEFNCKPQCKKCNRRRQGEHHLYREALIELFGKEAVEKLEHEAKLGGSLNSYGLQLKIDEYKEKVKQLKLEKGL